MSKKSTNGEIEIRIGEVVSLFLEGKSYDEILRHGSSKWGITTRQVEEYLARGRERLKAINSIEAQAKLGILIRVLWEALNLARIEGDYSAISDIVLKMAKLQGLDAQTITHVIEDNRELASLPEEDFEKLLLKESH